MLILGKLSVDVAKCIKNLVLSFNHNRVQYFLEHDFLILGFRDQLQQSYKKILFYPSIQ